VRRRADRLALRCQGRRVPHVGRASDPSEPVAAAVDRSSTTSPDLVTAGSKESGDLAVGNARIPVREALADNPDVRVLKYLISIDSSDGTSGRRVRARGVRVEIFNKKPDPESKVVAIISGSNAEMEFRDPPDPKTGFRDTVLLTMTLRDKNRVEYLDEETGARVALLENDELHLDDHQISGAGVARIEMEGLVAIGTDLSFDRQTSALTLQRDVQIRGTNFSLSAGDPTKGGATSDAGSEKPPEEKTIACDGRFSFLPRARDESQPTGQSDNMSAMLSGATMKFHENVVASQGTASRLDCSELEIVLSESEPESATTSERPARSAPSISRFFALGSASRPCRLADAMGTFIAESLLQEEKPNGSWITLNGSPRVENAGFGGGDAADPSSARQRFDAAASHQIRFRPVEPNQDATAAPTPDGATIKRFLVEIDGDATITAKGASPDENVRLDAAKIDMHLSAAPASAEGGAVAHGLDRLVARGNASGQLSKGSFHGEEISLIPDAASGAKDAYRLEIRPNPRVSFSIEPSSPDGVRQTALFDTPAGEFAWIPASGPTPANGRFSGPTTVRLTENEIETLVLRAANSIELALTEKDGKQSVSALDAAGNVTFDDTKSGASGRGDQMTLLPQENGQSKVRLRGSPAHALLKADDGTAREIDASTIEFDPADQTLAARDSVSVKLDALGLDARKSTTPNEPSMPARLSCHELDVRKDDAGRTVVDARGQVVIDDPANHSNARAESFTFVEGSGQIVLVGSSSSLATLTRQFSATTSDSPNYVTITGPNLEIDSVSKLLVCPRAGEIELVRPLAVGASTTRIRATSSGPIRYAASQLDLASDVVFRFDEDGSEVRSLWCDRAKILFDNASTPAASPPAQTSSGFKELVAEGRVRLDQVAPRPMVAEGHLLRSFLVDGKQTLHLRGSSPPCWIRGLSENEHLRYEADSFVVVMDSNDFTAENGRLVFEPEPVLK
jgi:hypothetical protein